MSDLARYNFYWTENVGSIQNEESGQYVLYSDYQSLEQKLEVAEGKISNIKVSLKNAYDHIQHEAYNDALSSILEAQHNIEGEE